MLNHYFLHLLLGYKYQVTKRYFTFSVKHVSYLFWRIKTEEIIYLDKWWMDKYGQVVNVPERNVGIAYLSTAQVTLKYYKHHWKGWSREGREISVFKVHGETIFSFTFCCYYFLWRKLKWARRWYEEICTLHTNKQCCLKWILQLKTLTTNDDLQFVLKKI